MTPHERQCLHCGKALARRPTEELRDWRRRVFCNRTCSLKARAISPAEKVINGSTLANGGCWEWHLHRDRKGYGRAVDAATGEVLAHRISWIAHHGPIPKGMHVLHRCDNPPCVNPEHLFLGTNDDNAADRHAKGRSKGAAGERNGKAKLLPEHVAQIRREVALLPLSPSGKRLKDGALAPVAAKYGISESSIRALVAGKTWSHIR